MTSTATTAQDKVAHHTFTIERVYPHPLERVWAAFADKEAKRLWFGTEVEGIEVLEYDEDFRVGGHGVSVGRFHASETPGVVHRFLSTYTDIVDRERIVYAYDMWLDDQHISTSITTVLLDEVADGTRLTFVEQGTHLDGHDSGAMREEGTRELLEALGTTL